MAIHSFVQWTFGFSYVLFVATAARDQIHSSHHDGHSFVCSMDLWFLLKFSYNTFLANFVHCVARMNILYAVFNSEILCSHICENPGIRLGPFWA